ncbi:MAG: hypothetical protein Q9166_005582 [cf. Caloplaca sp. 2 TL-2023]
MAKVPQARIANRSRSSTSIHNDQISIPIKRLYLSHANFSFSADPRFANIQTDPRFRLPSKRSTHVQIDKRFERMLRDEAFLDRAKVDRYGRRLPKHAGKRELEKYYSIEGDEGALIEDGKVESELQSTITIDEKEPSPSAEESSSDDESNAGETEDGEVFGLLDAQEMDDGAAPTGEITSRIAAVNLDWDNIRAADLMAVFSSFVPGAGAINKISVYPSEFGRERIEREEMEGPPQEIFSQNKRISSLRQREPDAEDQDDDDSNTEEDDEQIKKSLLQENSSQDFDSAKLRRYQLERLRYYYAVLICSSPSVAQAIYEAVDGTEYLTTANFFDLRFIPDEVDFSLDKPRDECERIPDGYRPNEFVTDALQHSKVKLTWDADDGTRKEAQKRAFAASRENIDANNLRAYLGSDSSDEGADNAEPIVVDATTVSAVEPDQQEEILSEPAPRLSKKDAERQRMRALLGLESKPVTVSKRSKSESAPVGDMQITFSSGFTSSSHQNQSIFANSPDDREETTVEKYIRKEKERKARRKSKLKASPEHAPDTSTNRHIVSDENHEKGPQKTKDLGFSDPFFADPDSAKTTAERKEAKRLKKGQHAAEEAAASVQRAELELLTMEDEAPSSKANHKGKGMRHFDMKEILKAEKAMAKSKKNKYKSNILNAREKEALEAKAQDRFRINTQDPRFGAVFQRPEFAIDPSHPRYQATGAMEELLKEGRRKRKKVDDIAENGETRGHERKSKKRGKEMSEGEKGEDVERLVARMKGKSTG